ncbi:MAG: LytTR family DNA-binding domain-containing protein [Thermodesulfobacteriota bacterium]|nr:LytTR family DNA-binding domain-containing protein [Thermodesulfobacteriota bacterium]
MQEIKAIIADDEGQLRSYLKSKLSDVWPDLVICGEAGNGQEALALIEEYRPHIAFLDIRMPGLSGMEVAKKIAGSCWVVFITAYDHYAVEAFESEAMDYILKPVTRKRLKKTTDRFKKQLTTSSGPPADLSKAVERIVARLPNKEMPNYLQWIRARQGKEIRLVPVEEVLYFKASDKYTTVITKGGESLIKKPIKELTSELDPNKFWRIHRGTIVNAGCIAKMSRSITGRGVVRLKDCPETLTVSRSYIHIFRQM